MTETNFHAIPQDDPNEMDRRRSSIGRAAMRKVIYIPFSKDEYRDLVEMCEYIVLKGGEPYHRIKDAVVLKEKLSNRFSHQAEIIESILQTEIACASKLAGARMKHRMTVHEDAETGVA